MNKVIVALFVCAPVFTFAQDVRDVMNARISATTTNTNAVTITATQGDGGTCSIVKQTNGKIAASVACVSSDGKTSLNSEVIRSNGAAATNTMVDFGDICGIVVINPTAAAVSMGSVGTVPANGIAWQFSTNVRVSGAITGQTAPVSGSIVWP